MPQQPMEWTDHNMSYDPGAGMSTPVSIYDNRQPTQAQSPVSEPNFSGLISFDQNMMSGMGQYGFGGYYGMSGVDAAGMPQGYGPQGMYAPNAEMLSPQDLQVDLNGAWTNLMNEAQYGSTHL